MRPTPPEQFRIGPEEAKRLRLPPHMATYEELGMNGMFYIPFKGVILRVIVSDGVNVDPLAQGWEHVSVSIRDRCPNWEEMCHVKNLFWLPEECCVEYHPAEKDYVNMHAYCLHIWRPLNLAMPSPPSIMVGLKGTKL